MGKGLAACWAACQRLLLDPGLAAWPHTVQLASCSAAAESHRTAPQDSPVAATCMRHLLCTAWAAGAHRVARWPHRRCKVQQHQVWPRERPLKPVQAVGGSLPHQAVLPAVQMGRVRVVGLSFRARAACQTSPNKGRCRSGPCQRSLRQPACHSCCRRCRSGNAALKMLAQRSLETGGLPSHPVCLQGRCPQAAPRQIEAQASRAGGAPVHPLRDERREVLNRREVECRQQAVVGIGSRVRGIRLVDDHVHLRTASVELRTTCKVWGVRLVPDLVHLRTTPA